MILWRTPRNSHVSPASRSREGSESDRMGLFWAHSADFSPRRGDPGPFADAAPISPLNGEPRDVALGESFAARNLDQRLDSTGSYFFEPASGAGEMQDCRGRFESEGEYDTIFQEVADGYDAVEWAAGSNPYITPLVVMRVRSLKAAGRVGRSDDRRGSNSAPSLDAPAGPKKTPTSTPCVC
jgi:hypothetical protein